MPPVSVVVRKVCEVVRLARSSVESIWMSLRLKDASTLLVLMLPVFVQWRMMPAFRPAMPPVAFVACTLPSNVLLMICPETRLTPAMPPICALPCTMPVKLQQTMRP